MGESTATRRTLAPAQRGLILPLAGQTASIQAESEGLPGPALESQVSLGLKQQALQTRIEQQPPPGVEQELQWMGQVPEVLLARAALRNSPQASKSTDQP